MNSACLKTRKRITDYRANVRAKTARVMATVHGPYSEQTLRAALDFYKAKLEQGRIRLERLQKVRDTANYREQWARTKKMGTAVAGAQSEVQKLTAAIKTLEQAFSKPKE